METEQAVNNTPAPCNLQPAAERAVAYAGVPQQFKGEAQSIAEHCKRYLRRGWKHQRTPKGYAAAWRNLWNLSSASSTARIFYSAGGYPAWLAHFLTVYSGRESRSFKRAKLATLEGFPVEVKRWIALELARTQPPSTVIEAMLSLQAKHPVPESQEIQPDSPSPSPSFESEDEMQVGMPAGSMLHADSSRRQFDHASPMRASEYFPHRVTSSILLHTNTRVSENGDSISEETLAITMDFPVVPVKADCVMQMAIVPNKIEVFARKLFGVDVETEGPVRYLICPNGTRVFPNPSFTLLDCQEDAIVPMFDEGPASAITSSEYRKQEKKKGKLAVTGCVSMAITSRAEEFATLTLNLALEQASSIRDSLYLTS